MEPAPEFSRPVPLDQIAERERVIKKFQKAQKLGKL